MQTSKRRENQKSSELLKLDVVNMVKITDRTRSYRASSWSSQSFLMKITVGIEERGEAKETTKSIGKWHKNESNPVLVGSSVSFGYLDSLYLGRFPFLATNVPSFHILPRRVHKNITSTGTAYGGQRGTKGEREEDRARPRDILAVLAGIMS